MRYDSPLRYPGGKARFAALLTHIIELNNLSGCSYFEPYAGGAGAALRLLREDVVSEIHLNDVDHRITAFWNAALDEPERFVDAILSVPVNIAEWKRQQHVYLRADASKPFDLGFSAFYLNRCNRSGVLLGGAPIGGYAQTGKWRIDARFNRENLAKRVLTIARKREQIHITNMDALAFLAKHLPHGRGRKRVFVYLDPPYYSNGQRLYLNFYRDRDHRSLSRYMHRQGPLRWVMSYDDASFIRDLYANCAISHFLLQYSLQRKRQARELLITPSPVRLPASVASIDKTECKAVTAY